MPPFAGPGGPHGPMGPPIGMHSLNFVAIMGLTIVGFSALLVLIKPSSEKRRQLDLLAILWLVMLAHPMAHSLLRQTGALQGIPRWVQILGMPMLYGPMFYLYVRELVSPSQSIRIREWLPLAALAIFAIFVPYLPPLFQSGRPGPARWVGIVDVSVAVAYSVAVFRLLRSHKTKVLEYHSSIDEQKRLTSVYVLLAMFVTSSFYVIINRIISPIGGGPEAGPPGAKAEWHSSGFLILIMAFSLFLARQRPIYGEGPEGAESGPEPDSDDDAPERVPRALDPAEVRSLSQMVESQKLYLDAELTLEELARILGKTRHTVSDVLNRGLNKSFYQYINGLRIDHAQELLMDSRYEDWPVMRIGLEAGFNSKATFNRLFKEYTGKTPVEYRRRAA